MFSSLLKRGWTAVSTAVGGLSTGAVPMDQEVRPAQPLSDRDLFLSSWEQVSTFFSQPTLTPTMDMSALEKNVQTMFDVLRRENVHSTGIPPCVELLIQKNILKLLCGWITADNPSGICVVFLVNFTRLIRELPADVLMLFLPNVNVHQPLCTLLKTLLGRVDPDQPSPLAEALVTLLVTITDRLADAEPLVDVFLNGVGPSSDTDDMKHTRGGHSIVRARHQAKFPSDGRDAALPVGRRARGGYGLTVVLRQAAPWLVQWTADTWHLPAETARHLRSRFETSMPRAGRGDEAPRPSLAWFHLAAWSSEWTGAILTRGMFPLATALLASLSTDFLAGSLAPALALPLVSPTLSTPSTPTPAIRTLICCLADRQAPAALVRASLRLLAALLRSSHGLLMHPVLMPCPAHAAEDAAITPVGERHRHPEAEGATGVAAITSGLAAITLGGDGQHAAITSAAITSAAITSAAITPAAITPAAITPAAITPAAITPAAITPGMDGLTEWTCPECGGWCPPPVACPVGTILGHLNLLLSYLPSQSYDQMHYQTYHAEELAQAALDIAMRRPQEWALLYRHLRSTHTHLRQDPAGNGRATAGRPQASACWEAILARTAMWLSNTAECNLLLSDVLCSVFRSRHPLLKIASQCRQSLSILPPGDTSLSARRAAVLSTPPDATPDQQQQQGMAEEEAGAPFTDAWWRNVVLFEELMYQLAAATKISVGLAAKELL
ncbi:hypothetical protein PAPYR_4719 [Paratrimastix pyriformis]|uniref:Uncharacterized protein n=1 Tax=Paratrimastix pyriformis TaxID=342808 RepID=A0ABQ8ULT0_9EUKA|nr:hypothetical protein PAPYR_4719 [Paratrimastix pyriformis]